MSTTSGGFSSSSQQYKLALNILGEHFGPLVRVRGKHRSLTTNATHQADLPRSIDFGAQDVGGYLLRRGQATLTDVRRFLEGESEHRGVKLSQVRPPAARTPRERGG